MEQEKKEAEEAKKKAKQKSLLGFLQGGGASDDDEGSIEISLAGLFKCMLCTHQKAGDEKAQLINIADSLEGLMKRLDNIEKYLKYFYDIFGCLLSRADLGLWTRMDIHQENGVLQHLQKPITTWEQYQKKVLKNPITKVSQKLVPLFQETNVTI